MDKKQLGKGAAIAGGIALAALVIPKIVRAMKSAAFQSGVEEITEKIDQKRGWHTLPTPVGLVSLSLMRHRLRKKNLYNTERPGTLDTAPPPPPNYLIERTVDGTYNDLSQPRMGAKDTRFGRNVPIGYTYPREDLLMTPNPRVVSRELMTRKEFQPAVTLNLLAAAWLQFQIRDWLSHGKSTKETPFEVPLPEGDDWPHDPMLILRVADDPTRTPDEEHLPPTHLNVETAWWDASQIYGSTIEFQTMVRTGVEGKMKVDRNNLVSPSVESLVAQANLAGWWVGMELMFTLFTREHNAICDMLQSHYPNWNDEALFQRARLINAALLAKIHTIEWTPAILGHPVLQIAMRINWWGLAGEEIYKHLGRLTGDEVISGIMGGKTDHFGVPYAMAEEFVGVYRMHPLIPDDYPFRSCETDEIIEHFTFGEIAGQYADGVMHKHLCEDVFYTFGRMHPGAIVLHNFPKGLQKFTRPDGVLIDLAAHDILRSRELGVPRYNEFRRLLHLKPFDSIDELAATPEWAADIKRVYNNDVELVDLSVGLFAEKFPEGFGFSDTAFRIFLLMASRRLNSDRFFTTDFRPEIYTPEGMAWLQNSNMSDVLLRHYPQLEPALRGVKNAFAPWNNVSDSPVKPEA